MRYGKWKKCLATLLAAVMLISILPVTMLAAETENGDTPTGISLQPLEEETCWISLTDILPSELSAVPVQKILNLVSSDYSVSQNAKTAINDTNNVAWAKDDYSFGTDNFAIAGIGDTIDLTPERVGRGQIHLEMVVGPNATSQLVQTGNAWRLRDR